MKSMTGYGRGESARSGMKFTVEITSVNRRQNDLTINLPRELAELEPRIREAVNARVSRGRLTLTLTCQTSPTRSGQHVQIDHALAREYVRVARQLGRELNLMLGLTVDTLLRAPGVVTVTTASVDAQTAWAGVATALHKALHALLQMREQEGRHLRADLLQRLHLIGRKAAAIRRRAPRVRRLYHQQLQQRLRQAGLEVPLDDERLLKEVALFADRSDITEELTRLDSHCRQFRAHLDSPQPVGRTLDFLTQEMSREINTLGAKANDSAISQLVVSMKAELEKIREQVQNIE